MNLVDREPLLLRNRNDKFESDANEKEEEEEISVNRQPCLIDWQKLGTRIRYYVPIIGWLPRYLPQKNLLFDFISGITVGFLLVPQSLSYAHGLAKLPPLVGLMTAIVSTLVYSLFGTSRQLSVGPEALVSIMTGMAVESFRKKKMGSAAVTTLQMFNTDSTLVTAGSITGKPIDPIVIMAFASTIAFAVGIISLIMGLLRLGFIDGVFSKSLLAGFIGAVAIVIEIEQLPNLLRIPSADDGGGGGGESSPLEKLSYIIGNIGLTHVPSLILSLCSVSFLFVSSFLKRRYPGVARFLPGTICLVLGTTFGSWLWDWRASWEILTLADIENTSTIDNLIRWPLAGLDKSDIQDAFSTAILITIIGFIESVVAAKSKSILKKPT